MFDLVIVALLVASAGVMAFGLLLLARQLFVDPRQLPWIAWPTFVLLALLLLGRWAKTKPGTAHPVRGSARGRIQAAASATTNSPFAKTAISLAIILLVGAVVAQSFSLFSAGMTILALALLSDFVRTALRDPKLTVDREE